MHLLLNAVTFPFIGEVNLSGGVLTIFCLCLLAVVMFEFVNGFHDTANAVATVIYTHALPPVAAVPWSGFFNFLGVFVSGVSVAMGILKLVPLNEMMALPVQVGACLVISVLLASIIWNLGTWYLGIPCSSSHTLIGAMIGGGLAFTYYYHGAGVNWAKAGEIGMSLIFSPLLGFGAAALLMLFLKHIVKSKQLFHVPHDENDKPPLLIRLLLITTCTLVSFFHGSNDGQKGVGLLMLILIAFVPAKFALDHSIPNTKIIASLESVEKVIPATLLSNPQYADTINRLGAMIALAKNDVLHKSESDAALTFKLRKEIQGINKAVKGFLTSKEMSIPGPDKAELRQASGQLEKTTDFAPVWVIGTISISLGLGTMIGWKRIVVTIGEKIGKQHLNYAQGATAEIVAAATIGLSTGFGLPVSTTHVLSSGVAGAMVASGGSGNLNSTTLKNIALAWVLTLPVSILLALGLFFLFHLFV
jgi:PiT family inorganic phosphate transporter